ncbi:MAG TPA: hypothetical protein VFQ44_00340 [Streptosporangiaceae bacterium]|nr:hypothetical protein [Streptosporangiaceae bacterium]
MADYEPENERYNPWTIVNLVFRHLADEGLHPVLGDPGNPGTSAAALLVALGIQPVAEGNKKTTEQVRGQLAELRAAAFSERGGVSS